jgi:hypothetical protein
LGQYEEAIKDCNTAIELIPNNAYAIKLKDILSTSTL